MDSIPMVVARHRANVAEQVVAIDDIGKSDSSMGFGAGARMDRCDEIHWLRSNGHSAACCPQSAGELDVRRSQCSFFLSQAWHR